jgi:hypothetical protein
MVQFFTDWLEFFDRLSGSSVFTVVLMTATGITVLAVKLGKGFRAFAKKCGVQKQLLVGHVQRDSKCTPSEALLKANEMTSKALRDE